MTKTAAVTETTKPRAQKAEANAVPAAAITAYKGFDQDLKCRGFQYVVGETFTHEGEVKACEKGFHSCEYPLNVFAYYAPAWSRFAIVKVSGDISREAVGDSKIASAQLTIEAEIAIPALVSRAVIWIMDRLDKTLEQTNTGDQSAASNTGNTGNYSAASNTGDYSAASNTGNQSAASNTGNRSAASNTGDYSAASNTGDFSAASNTGNQSAASNTGNYSAAEVSGKHAIAAVFGAASKAKASDTGAICLVNRAACGDIRHIRASKVGENGIKPDVFYRLELPALLGPLAGGTFAGITTQADGAHYAVVLISVAPDDKRYTYDQAQAHAESVGGQRPTRAVWSLLRVTCRDGIPADRYWADEPEGSPHAWRCHFGNGYVDSYYRSSEGGAVAVRLIPLTA